MRSKCRHSLFVRHRSGSKEGLYINLVSVAFCYSATVRSARTVGANFRDQCSCNLQTESKDFSTAWIKRCLEPIERNMLLLFPDMVLANFSHVAIVLSGFDFQ